jgi:hypothetical protein
MKQIKIMIRIEIRRRRERRNGNKIGGTSDKEGKINKKRVGEV